MTHVRALTHLLPLSTTPLSPMKLAERCAAIRLLLTDVDGVLTDGGVMLDNQGVESKCFNIRDGLAVRLWQQAGGQAGIVTGRSSQIVKLRAAELDMEVVRQGVKDKLPEVQAIAASLKLAAEADRLHRRRPARRADDSLRRPGHRRGRRAGGSARSGRLRDQRPRRPRRRAKSSSCC